MPGSFVNLFQSIHTQIFANMHHHNSEEKENAIAEHTEVVQLQPYPVEVGEKGQNDGWIAERNADGKDVVTTKTWIVCIVSRSFRNSPNLKLYLRANKISVQVLASAYGVSFWM
jgi:hypothetical protein